MSVRNDYTRLNHGIGPETPFRLKHDQWTQTGTGLRDMHYEVELGIVRRGRMHRFFSGRNRRYEAGELWLHGIWEPHSAEVLQAPLDLLVIHIDPATLAAQNFVEYPDCNWLAPFTMPVAHRPQGKLIPPARLAAYLTALDALQDPNEGADKVRQRLIVQQILLDILGGMKKNATAIRGVEAHRWQPNLEKVLELIFARRDWPSAGEMASRCGMSRNGFDLQFQKLMGISYAQFVLHHRLSGAAGDLRSGEKPLKVIARDWGFSDLSHFYRRFVAVYGCTPARFCKKP